MNDDPGGSGRGMAEPQQAQIEERALELARAAGRSAMNEYDLATARQEILGPSEEATGPVSKTEADEPEPEEEFPS